MHPLVACLLDLLALYAALGARRRPWHSSAFGVTRVQPAPMSLGARILILPGVAALWPYVLLRWLRAERP